MFKFLIIFNLKFAAKAAAYKRLDGGVELVASIPKSPAGKILRRLLRAQATNNKHKL